MNTGLVDSRGNPLRSAQMKKDPPPKQGESFGPWAGRDIEFMQMPGGGLVQFDLSKLRLEDFRSMRDHYQVNSSLAVLSFMQHQSDWTIECEDKAIAAACTEQLDAIWTTLNRSMATANWAGYAPNALNWDNNIHTRKMEISKVKDLIPEECEVHWKEVEGWSPPGRPRPKYRIYDGIDYAPQRGWPIPVENSYWYPLLMENGDYYGKKLLRPAFQSWFFSILIHLFANRYFERFGEPTPIGRAPFDDDIEVEGSRVRGSTYMLNVIKELRNRSVVVLPNDRTQVGANGQSEWEYDLEYLESQMRGADFERYLTRLDEEISLGLFTPILLLRTADVGSYNLGVGHMQVYLWMLNAMNDDRAQYIDKYILSKFTNFNFSPKAPRPHIKFRKMGNTDTDLIKQLLVALVSGGSATPDLDELGKLAGLSLKQVRQTTKPDEAPADPNADPTKEPAKKKEEPANVNYPDAYMVVQDIKERVGNQVTKMFREHRFGAKVNMGFKKKFEKTLEYYGVLNPGVVTDNFYGRLDYWLEDIMSLGEDQFSGPESFMDMFGRVLLHEWSKVNDAPAN